MKDELVRERAQSVIENTIRVRIEPHGEVTQAGGLYFVTAVVEVPELLIAMPKLAADARKDIERLKTFAALLPVDCDIQKDRTWSGQWSCPLHGVWFRSDEEPQFCPVVTTIRRAANESGAATVVAG